MINKQEGLRLAEEIAARVQELRELVRDQMDSDSTDDKTIARHVVMLGTATKYLKDTCAVKS